MHEDEATDLAKEFAIAALDGYLPIAVPASDDHGALLLLCTPDTDRSMRAVYSPHFSDRCKVSIACIMYALGDN